MQTNKPTQSLVYRSALILSAVVLLTVVNMLVSFLTAESVENDAVRINLAGSLRMQSYRISEALIIQNDPELNPLNEDLVALRIVEFEERLNRPVLMWYIKQSAPSQVRDSLSYLEQQWLHVKANTLAGARPLPEQLQDIDKFVVTVNRLVKRLEEQTENKFRILRFFQGVSLILIVIVVAIALWDMTNNLVAPLRRLVKVADAVREGDFTQRLTVSDDDNDELSQLANTINGMSVSLDNMYSGLEAKVKDKTYHLEVARDGLQFLYDARRISSGEGDLKKRLTAVLNLASRHFGASEVNVTLWPSAGYGDLHLSSAVRMRADEKPLQEHNALIARGSQNMGELQLLMDSSLVFEAEQNKLLKVLAANLADALLTETRKGQQYRLVLMEERMVIARELHDSLAQSLSYLKIQISRMQMLQSRGGDIESLNEAVLSIKEGIGAAYGQLRELLTTFRLQLSAEGLQAALEATAIEFEDRYDLNIDIDFHLDDHALTPNEEIHVLQIAREALSNVARHAEAHHVNVVLGQMKDKKVSLVIRDDGVGLGQLDLSVSHYGMVIMKERATTLGGTIEIKDGADGGAKVELRFNPSGLVERQKEVFK